MFFHRTDVPVSFAGEGAYRLDVDAASVWGVSAPDARADVWIVHTLCSHLWGGGVGSCRAGSPVARLSHCGGSLLDVPTERRGWRGSGVQVAAGNLPQTAAEWGVSDFRWCSRLGCAGGWFFFALPSSWSEEETREVCQDDERVFGRVRLEFSSGKHKIKHKTLGSQLLNRKLVSFQGDSREKKQPYENVPLLIGNKLIYIEW